MKLLIYTVNQIAIIGEVDRNAMTLLKRRIVIIDEIDKDKNWMHQDYNIWAERMYQITNGTILGGKTIFKIYSPI